MASNDCLLVPSVADFQRPSLANHRMGDSLDNDFIVFRGNDHEAAGQLLKGTVVLCLSSPLKIDNIHLRLTGTVHYTYVCKSGWFWERGLYSADRHLVGPMPR